MNNLAIIPARSGSKGLKDKNIKELYGKPLIGYSIDAAQKSGIFSEIIVSTDSKVYADISVELGAHVPFLRSAEKSNDTASSWDVVTEVLEKYRSRGRYFDSICLLQPTSPLRDDSDIIAGYRLLEEMQGDSVTSVCEVDHSPLWSMKLPDNLSLNFFNRECEDIPRQKMGTYYRLNGAIYIRKVAYIEKTVRILNDNDYALVMNRKHSIDIDTQDDFDIAEFYMSQTKDCGLEMVKMRENHKLIG